MIQWKTGLKKRDAVLYRQLPTRYTWSSTLWIARDGTCRRRNFNAISKTWRWSAQPQKFLIHDESGRTGLQVENVWTPLNTCIALAWKHRAPGSLKRTTVIDGKLPISRNINWVEPGDNTESSKRRKDETWSPLSFRVGLYNCPETFQISSRGRLRSPAGKITSGYFYDDSMVASVGEVLVDLLVASKLKPPNYDLPLHLSKAADCMLSGGSPRVFAKQTGLKLTTSWVYFTQVAYKMRTPDLHRVAPLLVPRDVWSALTTLQQQADPVLGGTLTDLLPAVEGQLNPRSRFLTNEHKFNILRLARLCVVSMCTDTKSC